MSADKDLAFFSPLFFRKKRQVFIGGHLTSCHHEDLALRGLGFFIVGYVDNRTVVPLTIGTLVTF
jgi:hypothetical protein